MIETCAVLREADLDVKIDGARRRVPLMYAAAAQQVEALELLLEAKADANVGDAEGVTPLMWACATRVRYPGKSLPTGPVKYKSTGTLLYVDE